MRKSSKFPNVFQALLLSVNLWYSTTLYKNISFLFYSAERDAHRKKVKHEYSFYKINRENLFPHLVSLHCHRGCCDINHSSNFTEKYDYAFMVLQHFLCVYNNTCSWSFTIAPLRNSMYEYIESQEVMIPCQQRKLPST